MVKKKPGCINSPTPDSLQTSVNNIHSNTMERVDNNKRRISSNEENVIVIDDDDDVVKREPETVSVTRTNSDQIPVKREPRENVDCNNRRNDEEPAPKKAHLLEVSYLNSEDDSSSVVVVTKYLAEFSKICASHGFKLSIECTNGTQTDVKIFQTALNCVISSLVPE